MRFLAPTFTRMKINKTQKRIIVAALFVLVIAMETAWVGVIYRKESQTFGKEIERFVEDAIVNEEWERRGKEEYYLDLRWKNYMFLEYQVDGNLFHIYTDRKLVNIYKNRNSSILYNRRYCSWKAASYSNNFIFPFYLPFF